MQPYFLPYIGYFQLIAAVDTFVVYDRIKYTKKGWINRNRMLRGTEAATFSLPLAQGSDSLHICERELAQSFDRNKLLNQFHEAYRQAPHFDATFARLQKIILFESGNLFEYLHHSITVICEYLGIATRLIKSSDVAIEPELKGQDKVLAICEALSASDYLNPIGGVELYSRQAFGERDVDLAFLQAQPVEYAQFGEAFIPWLSIVDVMMFNSAETISTQILPAYKLI